MWIPSGGGVGVDYKLACSAGGRKQFGMCVA